MTRSCKDPYYSQLVFDYLLHMGLLQTADSFLHECSMKNYLIPDYNETKRNIVSKLFKHFDHEEQKLFFKDLYSIIPNNKQSSVEFKKLVADLHVYFAARDYIKIHGFSEKVPSNKFSDAYGIDPTFSDSSADGGNPKIVVDSFDNSMKQSSMFDLSQFLEEKCASLRDCQEFSLYFSLPDVPNPCSHQLFQHALQKSWSTDLRHKLQEFVGLHYLAVQTPKIVLHLPSDMNQKSKWFWSQAEIDKSVTEQAKLSNPFCHLDTHVIEMCNNVDNFEEIIEGQKKTSYVHRDGFFSDMLLTKDDTENSNPMSLHTHNNSALFFKRQIRKGSTSLDQAVSEDSSGEEKLMDYKFIHLRLKDNFNQLHSDYHNLIGVTTELTGALEKSVRGEDVNLRDTLNNCLKIFPELFSLMENTQTQSSVEKTLLQPSIFKWNLDIARVKKDLLEGNMKTRLLLLQALRWAITRSSVQQRELVMSQLIAGDFLNLEEDFLIRNFLIPPGVETPHPIQQSMARLLNTLASIRSGRSYLSKNPNTVNVSSTVMQQLGGVSIDSVTKNMLMAALQKLSLRQNQRIAMIELGMVEWLFQQLSNVESSYSIEYGIALLMNLCLHKSAKERCVPISRYVITVLLDLLSTSIVQALPYVSGTLYSLLTHPLLNKIAAEIGMTLALEAYLKTQSNDEIRKQIEHILYFHQSMLLHKSEDSIPLSACQGEMIDGDNEELDLLGEELDEQDPVRSISGDVVGEDLLRAQYTLPTENSGCREDGTGLGVINNSSPFSLRPNAPTICHQSAQHNTNSDDSEGLVVARIPSENGKLGDCITNHSMSNSIAKQRNSHEWKEKYISSDVSTINFEMNKQTCRKPSKMISKQVMNQSNGNNGIICKEKNNYSPLIGGGKDKKRPQMSPQINNPEMPQIIDDDMLDVQVGSMPGTDLFQELHSNSSIQSVESAAIADPPEQEIERQEMPRLQTGDTAAFASRPKIPRTPPHRL